jgi:hypothetical protein
VNYISRTNLNRNIVDIISVLQGEIYVSSTDDLKEHSEYLDSSHEGEDFEH